jgi:hypothetical protein
MKLIKKLNLNYALLIFLVFVSIIFSKITLDISDFTNVCTVKQNLSVHFNSGLLIGFRNDVDKDVSTYRTLWIAPDKNNNLKVVKEMNFILVPHKDTFWQVEPIYYSFTNTEDSIEYPVAHAISDSYTPSTFEYNHNTYKSKLEFVDRNHVSIFTYITNHHNNENSYINESCSIVELEKLTEFKNTEDRLTMYDIFKDKAIPIIKKYKNEKITLGESPHKNSVNTTSGDNWNIARDEGKWVAEIGKTFKYSGNNIKYILYNTDLDLPQSIVSYNELCTSFSSIKNLIPDAEDAISSPDKEILGVFTPNKLTLYPYSDNKIGKSVLDIDLGEHETMIMAQWTSENTIEDWTNTLNTSFPELPSN